jgi:hypothetical protein
MLYSPDRDIIIKQATRKIKIYLPDKMCECGGLDLTGSG